VLPDDPRGAPFAADPALRRGPAAAPRGRWTPAFEAQARPFRAYARRRARL